MLLCSDALFVVHCPHSNFANNLPPNSKINENDNFTSDNDRSIGLCFHTIQRAAQHDAQPPLICNGYQMRKINGELPPATTVARSITSFRHLFVDLVLDATLIINDQWVSWWPCSPRRASPDHPLWRRGWLRCGRQMLPHPVLASAPPLTPPQPKRRGFFHLGRLEIDDELKFRW